MFRHTILDQRPELSPKEKRLYSCIRLVADECREGVFYLNEHWTRKEFLNSLGFGEGELNLALRQLLEKHNLLPLDRDSLARPKLAYFDVNEWASTIPSDREKVLLRFVEREFIASSNDMINKGALSDQGLNANTAILALAAVGIDIILPNVSFENASAPELDEFRDKFSFERHEYLDAVAEMAETSLEGIASRNWTDLIRWAENEVEFKLVPKARALHEAIPKYSPKKLKSAGYSFWRDGTPSIGSALLSGGLLGGAIAGADQLLRSLVSTLASDVEKRSLPEIGYAMKISQRFSTG